MELWRRSPLCPQGQLTQGLKIRALDVATLRKLSAPYCSRSGQEAKSKRSWRRDKSWEKIHYFRIELRKRTKKKKKKNKGFEKGRLVTARDLGYDWFVFPVLLDHDSTQHWPPCTNLRHTDYRTETALPLPYCSCIPRLEVLREGLLLPCSIEEETWGWEFTSWAESPRNKGHQPTPCNNTSAGLQSSGVTSSLILFPDMGRPWEIDDLKLPDFSSTCLYNHISEISVQLFE